MFKLYVYSSVEIIARSCCYSQCLNEKSSINLFKKKLSGYGTPWVGHAPLYVPSAVSTANIVRAAPVPIIRTQIVPVVSAPLINTGHSLRGLGWSGLGWSGLGAWGGHGAYGGNGAYGGYGAYNGLGAYGGHGGWGGYGNYGWGRH